MARKRQSDEAIRDEYAELAAKGRSGPGAAGQAGSTSSAAALGYSQDDLRQVPEGAVAMGLGCGNPTAIAELQPGEVALDLGSGGGLDAFLAARKVAPRGKVIGVDMTAEMVHKAARFAAEGRYENVEFRLGRIEDLPLRDDSVDVVLSNCVINHASDKPAVFREALRVLRPGGRLCITDLVVEGRVPRTQAPGMEVWAAWLAVACGKQAYLDAVALAGFTDIRVTECPYRGCGMIPALEGKIARLELTARKPG